MPSGSRSREGRYRGPGGCQWDHINAAPFQNTSQAKVRNIHMHTRMHTHTHTQSCLSFLQSIPTNTTVFDFSLNIALHRRASIAVGQYHDKY